MRRILFLAILFCAQLEGGCVQGIHYEELGYEKTRVSWEASEGSCYRIYAGYEPDFKPNLENLQCATYEPLAEVEGYAPYLKIVAEKDGVLSEPSTVAKGYVKPSHISQEVWNLVAPHFIPENHPMKGKLDAIFSDARVITSDKTMKKAGFGKVTPRKYTHVCVCKHPELEGLLVKLYLHAQRYHNNHPEHYFWLLRIEGVRAIQEMVDANGWGNTFSTPKKWIYPMPEETAPQKEFIRKNFILVEEDMSILDDTNNRAMWRSEVVDIELLDKLYQLTTTLGLHDCTKPDNIPFCQNGKIAFIDTQTVYMWPVLYKKLLPHLTPQMHDYWKGRFKE